MTKFYREEAKPFLYNGRMTRGLAVECGTAPFGHNLPEILSSAWEADGKRVQILINAFDEEKMCRVGGKEMVLAPNSATMIEI